MKAATLALWASIVRTIVPIIVGTVLGWTTALGITVDREFEPLLGAVLTGAFSAVYYIAARLLEVHVAPKLGWLLGYAKAPVEYSSDAKHRAS